MAIAVLKDNLEELIKDSSVDQLDIQSQQYQLNNLLDLVKEQENKMLKDCFGVTITREELRKNLQGLSQKYSGLSKLTGYTLRQITTYYLAQTGDLAAQDQLQFQQMLMEGFAEWQPPTGKNKDLEQYILSLVRETMEPYKEIEIGKQSHSGQVRALPSLRGKQMEDIANVYLNNLADVTGARIRKYLKDHKKKVSETSVGNAQKIAGDQLIIKPDIDWFKYTQGGRAASKVDLSENEIRTLNLQFKTDLSNFLTQECGHIPYLDEILNHVFRQRKNKQTGNLEESKILFVGNNAQQIIGLCGEIQALCYLALLLGNKFEFSPEILNWTAQETNSGKSYHADIVLKQFGIQVKNTQKEFVDEVCFRNSTFDTFLGNLVKEQVIDEETKEDILNIYEAYYFNVPYQLTVTGERRKSRAGNWTEVDKTGNSFDDLREQIIRLHSLADGIIKNLVGQLLYIGVGNAAQDQIGNIMFFIGGKLIFASEILEEISKHIDDEIQNFQVNISMRTSYTIINALQQNGFYIYNYPRLSELVADEYIRNEMMLKSSYDFTSLVK